MKVFTTVVHFIPIRAKLNVENINELTALDIARNWGDDYIYAIMYAKCGTLLASSTTEKKGTTLSP